MSCIICTRNWLFSALKEVRDFKLDTLLDGAPRYMKVINHQLKEGFTVTPHFLLPILGFQHLQMMEVFTIQTGWWFGTCFIFHNIWDNPSH